MDKKELQTLINKPVDFLESKYGYYVPETKKPIKHLPWERKVLTAIFNSEAKVRVIGDIKKNLKTTKAAEVVFVTALKYPDSEVYVLANDFEQAKSRVFTYLLRSLRLNPYVNVQITRNQITFSNGSIVKALPSDYRGEAGANPRLTVLDEPWGFVSESAVRMVEEFTPPPNIPEAFQLFTGYAGFEGESEMWLRIYEEGLKGDKIDDELPLYESDGIIMYWSHGPLEGHPGQPWHTKKYFARQKNIVRPFQFLRLHHNRFVAGTESFVTQEEWRKCVDESYSPPLPNDKHPLYIGVDCGIKSDNAAVVSVWIDHQKKKLALGPYRLWKPSKAEPLDIENTIGEYLRWLHRNYRIREIQCDPWQLHHLITELKTEGLRIAEFPQTTANLTAATQNLFDLLSQRNLILPDDKILEEQSQNAIAVESSRGLKLAKEKSTKKIDSIVALMIACLFAVEEMNKPKVFDVAIQSKSPINLRGLVFERPEFSGKIVRRRLF